MDDIEADVAVLSGRIPELEGGFPAGKLGRGAGFLAGTPSETDARGRDAPGPVEERRGVALLVGEVTEARVVPVTGAALLAVVDAEGRELVEDERDLVAGGAMEVLRAAVVVPAGLEAVVVGEGLAELLTDVPEGVFFTVGVGGVLVDVDMDDDGFEAGGGLVWVLPNVPEFRI
jgi:hypothetical protein